MADMPTLMNLNEAARVTSLSRSQINVLRRAGRFPAAVVLGEKRVAFVRDEVEKWVRDRIAARPAKVQRDSEAA